MRAYFSSKQVTPLRVLEYSTQIPELPAEASSALVIATPKDTAVLLRAYARPGLKLFSGPAAARIEAPDGVAAPIIAEPAQGWDYTGAQAYDGVRLLVEAVRKAGLNRERIRVQLRKMSPWQGVAGPIVWNNIDRNTRAVRLGTVRGGVLR
jgi:hypothetical protein